MKGTRENVFASLNLRDRSCHAPFSREGRRTCNTGQFYTYRRTDASGWVLRSAALKGSGHGGSDARASSAPGASRIGRRRERSKQTRRSLSLIHISEPTRQAEIS